MYTLPQTRTKQGKRGGSARGTTTLRYPLLRIRVIHSDKGDIYRSLQELKDAKFRVRADVVLTPERFTKRWNPQSYDLILVDHPTAEQWQTQVVALLRQDGRYTSVIFLTDILQRETVAERVRKCAADCIQMENIGYLPVVIRRVLREEQRRQQCDRAGGEVAAFGSTLPRLSR